VAQFAGRSITVKTGTDGTTWSAIGEMDTAELSINGATIDVTKFGDNDIERILGLRDANWSLSGRYDPTDTTGQVVLRSSLLNDTPVYLQFEFDPSGTSGNKGFHQQVIVTKFDMKATAAGTVDLSLTADSTGAITAD
jgi:hypothetical protein